MARLLLAFCARADSRGYLKSASEAASEERKVSRYVCFPRSSFPCTLFHIAMVLLANICWKGDIFRKTRMLFILFGCACGWTCRPKHPPPTVRERNFLQCSCCFVLVFVLCLRAQRRPHGIWAPYCRGTCTPSSPSSAAPRGAWRSRAPT